MRGVPIYNVNNNCATGSTALFMAQQVRLRMVALLLLLQLQRSSHTLKLVGWYSQLIAGGIADCTLALGFEKMFRGSLPIASEDREQPIEKHMKVVRLLHTSPTSNHMTPPPNPFPASFQTMAKHMGGFEKAPPAPWLFACAGREHMKRFGTSAESFARVAVKNHKHRCVYRLFSSSSASLSLSLSLSHPCSSPMPA